MLNKRALMPKHPRQAGNQMKWIAESRGKRDKVGRAETMGKHERTLVLYLTEGHFM